MSISSDSDSESNMDDNNQLTENEAEEISLAHDLHPKDSLPSISAIVAFMSIPRPFRTEKISEHSQVMPSHA